MNGITSETIVTTDPGAVPTVENLVRHFRRFGLSARDGRGREVRYTAYSKFRDDALVEVARARLGEEAFVQLVSLIGYDAFADDARKDWRQVREAAA